MPVVCGTVAQVCESVSFVRVRVAVVGFILTLVCESVSIIGSTLALVGQPVPFVSFVLALIGQPITFIGVLTPARVAVSAILSDLVTLDCLASAFGRLGGAPSVDSLAQLVCMVA